MEPTNQTQLIDSDVKCQCPTNCADHCLLTANLVSISESLVDSDYYYLCWLDITLSISPCMDQPLCCLSQTTLQHCTRGLESPNSVNGPMNDTKVHLLRCCKLGQHVDIISCCREDDTSTAPTASYAPLANGTEQGVPQAVDDQRSDQILPEHQRNGRLLLFVLSCERGPHLSGPSSANSRSVRCVSRSLRCPTQCSRRTHMAPDLIVAPSPSVDSVRVSEGASPPTADTSNETRLLLARGTA